MAIAKPPENLKDTFIQEVSRIIYPSSSDIVTEVYPFDIPTPLQNFTQFTGGLDPQFRDALSMFFTHLWTPEEYATQDEFDYFGYILTKADYTAFTNALLRLYNDFGDIPYGGLSGLGVFYNPKYPCNRFVAQGAVNGTVFIDTNELMKYKGPMTYAEAVQRRVVIAFIKSTWSIWHEYAQVGPYLYHIVEHYPVSTGVQIINIEDPYHPFVANGTTLTQGAIGEWANFSGGLVQGAHFISVENTRPYLYLAGATPFNASLRPLGSQLFGDTITCEPNPFTDSEDPHSHPPTDEVSMNQVNIMDEINEIQQLDFTSHVKLTLMLNKLREHSKRANLLAHPELPDPHPELPSHTHESLTNRIGLIYNVSNPAIPRFVSSWNRTYAHDMQVVKRGDRYIMVAAAIFNESFYFVDVTYPETLQKNDQISHYCIPPLSGAHLARGGVHGPAFAFVNVPHSIYFDCTGRFMYSFNENTDLPMYVWDICDFLNVKIINQFYLPRYGTLMHEAKREVCHPLGIDRLTISAYEAGVLTVDIFDRPVHPSLLGWNIASTRTSPVGNIQLACEGGFCGFWGHQPLNLDGYSVGGLRGGRFTTETERAGLGLSEDSATVLFQLLKTPECEKECDTKRYDVDEILESKSHKKLYKKYSKHVSGENLIRLLCLDEQDAFASNLARFTFLTRLWFRLC